jgi:hypothetical protein
MKVVAMNKVCSRCGTEKDHSDFTKRSSNKNGIGAWCKECSRDNARNKHSENKEINNLRTREWKKNNPEKVKAYSRKWQSEHVDENREYSRIYAETHREEIKACRERTKEQRAARAKIYRAKNKERAKATWKAWADANPGRKREALRNWRAANPEKDRAAMRRANTKRGKNIKYRISGSVSRRIRTSLFDNGSKGNQHWEALVDFTVDQLKGHLEKLFKPGMTWENYGTTWEIDHKIPLSAFNFDSPDHIDFKICWSLKNLQPLEKAKNRSKSAKIDRPFQPALAIAV